MVLGKDVFYPSPFTVNIRQSYGKSERFKEKGNRVEYGGKLEDADCGDDICLLAQRFCNIEEKLKRLKGRRIRSFAYVM
jgi:hypothetical protein